MVTLVDHIDVVQHIQPAAASRRRMRMMMISSRAAAAAETFSPNSTMIYKVWVALWLYKLGTMFSNSSF